MRAGDYEAEHYRCSNCKHYNKDCLRVDGVTVDFAKPWFKSQSDCGCVCCDFELKDYMVYAKRNWISFDVYFQEYIENWLPYHNTNTLIYFTIKGDTSIRYGVKLLDFVYGNMYLEDGSLNAVEKMYYKRVRTGFGYELIRDSIKGVMI